MEKSKLIDIVENVSDRSNKDLNEAISDLYVEFNETKELIINLTRHLDTVENSYNKVNDELKKRYKK
jgi:prefoldin subunit 5